MARMERSIDVNVPVEAVYAQWTQFEQFPMFMEGVHDVRQVADRTVLWRAEIMGRVKEWRTEVTEEVPEQRLAWRDRAGGGAGGIVTFHRLARDQTRVVFQVEYDPESTTDVPATVAARAEGDLRRFKALMEVRGADPHRDRGERGGT